MSCLGICELIVVPYNHILKRNFYAILQLLLSLLAFQTVYCDRLLLLLGNSLGTISEFPGWQQIAYREIKDPRFDELVGKLKDDVFKKRYAFLYDEKLKDESSQIKKKLKACLLSLITALVTFIAVFYTEKIDKVTLLLETRRFNQNILGPFSSGSSRAQSCVLCWFQKRGLWPHAGRKGSFCVKHMYIHVVHVPNCTVLLYGVKSGAKNELTWRNQLYWLELIASCFIPCELACKDNLKCASGLTILLHAEI